jgi:signal transduction histidine kinase
MTLQLRFTLLLGLLLAMFLAGVHVLRSTHRAETLHAIETERQERSRALDELIGLLEYPLDQFTRDYSQWDEMVRFVAAPDPGWATVNIDASLDTFRLRAAWILTPSGRLLYTASRGETSPAPGLPVATDALLTRLSQDPFARFHLTIGGDLCTLRAAPIQPSSDLSRISPPVGWLIAAEAWDQERLARLGKLLDARATLLSATEVPVQKNLTDGFDITRPLDVLPGSSPAFLKLHYQPPEFASAEDFNRDEMLIFVVQGLLLIVVTSLCVHLWVVRPVKKIIVSLRGDDPSAVAALSRRGDETGLIARLVQSHFADRRSLEQSERSLAHTLAERVRLGRDLHDNVIQSLYATGMGLASTHRHIRTSPDLVEEGLEQIRATLNEVIRDIRTFIVGLEPDSPPGETFTQTVTHLTESLRAIHPLHFEVEIDEDAAHKLPPDQRQHALQIIRESLLNSIRHSGATHLRISLDHSTDTVTLTLTDDGRPASTAENTAAGLGLAALAARARLVGARMEIIRQDDHRTRLQIRYACTPHPLV